MMTVKSLVHFICVLLLVFQIAAPLALAQAASNNNFDLSSSEKTVTAGTSGTITVGGASVAVTPESVLTPAESVALSQVLGGGTQNLVLDASGRAIGGQFVLNSNNLSSLVIPNGVSAVNNFAHTGDLTITGNLVNSGNFYAVSNSTQMLTAIISAQNINNLQGGLLTSVLPQGGISGFTGLVSNLSLTLNAVQNIVNYGVISSAANLNMTAGGSIINALPTGMTGPNPIISAMSNINMLASSIQNTSGLISSLNANVNLATQVAQNLSINNVGGIIEAMNGNINIRDELFQGKFDTFLTGGDWQSKQLNIWSGNGNINVDVNSISGQANLFGGNASLVVASGDLHIGAMDMSGDPLISAPGDILLETSKQWLFPGPESLTISAGGDIINVDVTEIGTFADSGATGAITMIAGGMIDLQTNPISVLSTSTTGAKAGNITLSAGGPILLSGSISTTSSGGDAGNITIVSGGNVETTGTINASSTDGKGGTVTVVSGAQINSVGLDGSFFIAGGNGQPGAVSLDSIVTSGTTGGAINVVAFGGGISTGNLTSLGGGNITVVGAGPINVGSVDATGGSYDSSNPFANGNGNVSVLSATPTTNAIVSIGKASIGAMLTKGVLSGGFSDLVIVPGYPYTPGTFQITSSAALKDPSAGNPGSIVCGTINTSGGSVLIRGGGSIQTTDVTSIGSTGLIKITNVYNGVSTSRPGIDLGDISAFSIIANSQGTLNAGTISGKGGTVIVSDNSDNLFTVGAGGNVQLVSNIGTGDGKTAESITIVKGGTGDLVINQALDSSTFSVTNAVLPSITIVGNNTGTVHLPGTISVGTGFGSTGGSITLIGNTFAFQGAGNLQANGTNNGSGGYVYISTANLLSPGGLIIDANGSGSGSGGVIEISSSSLSGSVNLVANANAGGTGAGFGGDITIAGGTSGALGIAAHANGGTLGGQGGSIFIDSSNIPGADINLGGNSLTANSFGFAQGGSVIVRAGGDLTIANGSISALAGSTGGSGGEIRLYAGQAGGDGVLSLNGNLNVNGFGSGDGGTLVLEAPNLVSSSGTSVISANSGSSGIGGLIIMRATDPNGNFSIGGGNDQFLLSATGSNSGDGGAIEISSAGTLTLNGSNGLDVRALGSSGAGGWLTFVAGFQSVQNGQYQLNGSGDLFVNQGNFAVNGVSNGDGGKVTLLANNVTAAAGVGISAQGGTNGGNGGSVSIQSIGGDINLASINVNTSASSSGADGGTVSIIAGSNNTITGNSVINSSSSNGVAGDINISAGGPSLVGRVSLDGSVLANSGGTSSGGNITFSQNSSLAMQLQSDGIISASNVGGGGGKVNFVSSNSDLTVVVDKAIQLNGSSTDTMGTISVSSSGKANITVSNAVTAFLSGSAASDYSFVADGSGSTLGVKNISAGNTATIKATATDGSIVFDSGATLNSQGAIEIGAPNIQFKGDATVSMASAGVLKVNSGNQSSSLNMDFANGSTVTFNVTQGTSIRPGVVEIGPNGTGSLTMNSSGAAAVEFTGGTVSMSTSDGAINLGSGLTINSDVFDATENIGMEMVATNGDINLNASISARQLNVSTITTGNINLGSDINSPTVVMNVQGNSTINQTGTGSVGIGTLVINTQNGDVGSVTNPIEANVLELQVNGTGSAYIRNASTVDVKTSNLAGTLQITNDGDVAIESNVTTGSLNINATGSISMFGQTSGSGGVALASGTGSSIEIGAGVQLSTSAGSVLLTTDRLVLDGSILAQGSGANVSVTSSDSLSLSGSSGRITASGANNFIDIAANSITFESSYVLNAGSNGTVQIQSASLSPNGVTLNGGVTVTAAGGSQLNVFTNALNFGDGSAISISNGMSVVSTGGTPLTVNVASNTNINSLGGAAQFLAGVGGALVFQSTGITSGNLNVNGGNLVASSTGADTSLNNVNLSSSNNIQIAVNGGTLNLNGNITSSQDGGVIVLQDPDGITISGNGTVGFTPGLSGSIAVQALTPDALLQFVGTPQFNAGSNGSVTFEALGGIIFADGSSPIINDGAAFNMYAPTIVFGSQSQVLATGASSMNISGINGSDLNIVLPSGSASLTTSGGNINVSTVSGSSINFVQAAVGGSSTLNFSGGPVSISTSNASITIAENVTLAADNNISVSTPGGSLINNGQIQGSTPTTIIRESGDLVINNIINAYSLIIETTANNGSITLSANINVDKDLTVSANGSGSILQTSGLLSAETITLTSGSGNIGSSSGRIQVKADNLNVSTTGSAYINAQGGICVESYNVGGGFDLTASGNIHVGAEDAQILSINSSGHFNAGSNGTVTFAAANQINIVSGVSLIADESAMIVQSPFISMGTGSKLVAGGNLSVFGNIAGGAELRLISKEGNILTNGDVSGTNLLVLQTGSNGNITMNGNISAPKLWIKAHGSGNISQLAGTVNSSNVILSSGFGNIGSSLQPLNISGGNLQVETGGNGVVNVNSLGSVTVLDSKAGGSFALNSNGALSIGNVKTSNGSILLTAAGAIEVQQSRNIIANQGNLTIQNTSGTGSILVGKNASLQAYSKSQSTGLGNVFLVVGEVPSNPVKGSAPKGVSVSQKYGGQVYFGNNGITVKGNRNEINAWGSNVVFSSGSKSAIVLDGGVYIIADPPPDATPASMNDVVPPIAVPQATLLATPAFVSPSTLSAPINLNLPVIEKTVDEVAERTQTERLKPIACVTALTMAAQRGTVAKNVVRGISNAGNRIYTASNVEYTNSDVIFEKGEMVLAANHPTEVRCKSANVAVSNDTCVLLKSNNKGLEVFNLCESHWGGVKVKVSSKEFIIGAGQRILINQESLVAFRNEKTHKVGQQTVKISEFALISLLSNSDLLSRIMHSELREDRQLGSKLFKMAACLNVVTASHGPFKMPATK